MSHPEWNDYEVEIKESRLDMLGHMNNAEYLVLFEEARWEYITARGYGLNKIMETQKGPVILEANIKFLKEIKLREKVRITFESSNSLRKIVQIKQKMIKVGGPDDGQVASELEITIGFFDLKERKLILPTPEWQKVLE